jgi:hypothetical protein
MSAADDTYNAVASAFELLAELAERKGVERAADLGNVPPLGTPEFAAWAEREGIDLEGLDLGAFAGREAGA